MAAATTSLPETPGGARNWDYRFTWIRDSSFMLRSLYRLGFDWEALEYFAFIIEALAGGSGDFELQIMYGIDGRKDLTEQTLDHLSGWRNSRPVRVGNGAWDQHQNDVWGMLLDAVDIHLRQGAAQIVKPMWEGLAKMVEAAIAHAGDPDQGIWEIRGDPEHFTASKVLCWVAMDRGADMARIRQEPDRAEAWRKAADELKAEILDQGVDSRGRFRQAYGNEELDASLLLIPILGFLPPDDERVRATVLAIADELTEDGLVLRYKVDSTDTGFEGKEGTFTICSFWLVTALAMIGEEERARALCQKLLAFADHGQRGGEPERTDGEGPFLALEPGVGGVDLVAQHQSVLGRSSAMASTVHRTLRSSVARKPRIGISRNRRRAPRCRRPGGSAPRSTSRISAFNSSAACATPRPGRVLGGSGLLGATSMATPHKTLEAVKCRDHPDLPDALVGSPTYAMAASTIFTTSV